MTSFFNWVTARMQELTSRLKNLKESDAMSTNATPVLTVVDPNSLEGKIDQAALEAGQIASTFSPAIGAAVQAGVAFEPMIHGMISLFASLFHHHAAAAVAVSNANAAPAPAAAAPAPAPAPVVVLPAPVPVAAPASVAVAAPAPVAAPAATVAAPAVPTAQELKDQIAKLQAELDALNQNTSAPTPTQATPPANHPTGL